MKPHIYIIKIIFQYYYSHELLVIEYFKELIKVNNFLSLNNSKWLNYLCPQLINYFLKDILHILCLFPFFYAYWFCRLKFSVLKFIWIFLFIAYTFTIIEDVIYICNSYWIYHPVLFIEAYLCMHIYVHMKFSLLDLLSKIWSNIRNIYYFSYSYLSLLGWPRTLPLPHPCRCAYVFTILICVICTVIYFISFYLINLSGWQLKTDVLWSFPEMLLIKTSSFNCLFSFLYIFFWSLFFSFPPSLSS